MLTCEDCTHYEVCLEHRECKDFKDRSQFVEQGSATWVKNTPNLSKME